MCPDGTQTGDTIDYIDGQIEAVYLIDDGELKRSVDVSFLLVTPYVQVDVVRTTVTELVNQGWVRMKIKNDRLIDRHICLRS